MKIGQCCTARYSACRRLLWCLGVITLVLPKHRSYQATGGIKVGHQPVTMNGAAITVIIPRAANGDDFLLIEVFFVVGDRSGGGHFTIWAGGAGVWP